jgi:D-lactate dehydrogenase (cytochrome)
VRVNHAVATAPPVAAIELETDPDLIAQYLEDAAHYPGGYAIGLVRPRTIDEVAAAVGAAPHVLPVGARSSLTGGATPAGDLIVSTERLGTIRRTGDGVVVGAGVPLQAVQAALNADGLWLPPVPTYLGATVGGAISTNAAGAATFKYGPMRPWVRAMTVVLASGDVLALRRGDATASAAGAFVVTTRDGQCHVPIPAIRMPDVPKRSAGYHCAGDMDLVDLFIGAEGTLGIVVEAELAVRPRPAGVCWLLAPLGSETQAIALAGELRAEARSTWRSGDPAGIDVAAIEHIDRRSLDILREDGVDRRLHVAVSADAEVILLAQIELSAAALARDLWGDLTDARSPTAADTPITRLCRLLDRYGVLDAAEIALPDSPARAAQLVELREAVPAGVNRRVGLARRIDPRISKTAADMIVPYDQFGAMMRDVRARASAARLDIAVWGHISDGNVHPNVLPRSYDELERGRAMLVDMARDVIARGGCPLAEHGVGRNPIKQAMLQMLYGDEGIAAMRRIKLSLDPGWKLASGVLFAPPAALTRSTPPSSDA